MPIKVEDRLTLFSILIIARESEVATELCSGLIQNGFACSVTPDWDSITEQLTGHKPELVIVEMNGTSGMWELPRRIKQERSLPIIALVDSDILDSIDGHLDTDDWVITPCDVRELSLRVTRLLRRNSSPTISGLIRCAGLVIDPAECEVTVGGRPVVLTFKEYELLKFLASNRGRVFTREVLLDRVWGYDYYGGDRTVDVHVRRLRSKIEDATSTFIETVRNVGYRFRKES